MGVRRFQLCAVAVVIALCSIPGSSARFAFATTTPSPEPGGRRCVAASDTVAWLADHLVKEDLTFTRLLQPGDTLEFETVDAQRMRLDQGTPPGTFALSNGNELMVSAPDGNVHAYEIVVPRRAVEAHISSRQAIFFVVTPNASTEVGEELTASGTAEPLVGPNTTRAAYRLLPDAYAHAALYVDPLRVTPFTLSVASLPQEYAERLARAEPLTAAALDAVTRIVCSVRVEPWNGRVVWPRQPRTAPLDPAIHEATRPRARPG